MLQGGVYAQRQVFLGINQGAVEVKDQQLDVRFQRGETHYRCFLLMRTGAASRGTKRTRAFLISREDAGECTNCRCTMLTNSRIWCCISSIFWRIFRTTSTPARSEERRVGKECRS